MYMQGVDSVYDLKWWTMPDGSALRYGDIYHQNEVEQSAFNFELADVDALFAQFDAFEKSCEALVDKQLPLPAYDMVLKASHAFNLLDARHAISVTERQRYMLRVRNIARATAIAYRESRERLGFPLVKGAAREALSLPAEASND